MMSLTGPVEAWRLDDKGQLDDIVVPNVETFRLERMGANAWWIGLYLPDGRVEHIDLVAGRRATVVASRRTDDPPAGGSTRTDPGVSQEKADG